MARPTTSPEFICGTHGGRCKSGEPCGATVITGTKRCANHAGKKKAVAKMEGHMAMQLKAWGLDGHSTMADAGETLLKLVTQSAARVELYSSLLGSAFNEDRPRESVDAVMRQSGVGTLIGYRYGVDREGHRFPIEEAVRGLVKLEAEERDRCANFARMAVAAGLAERQVRMAEAQGMLMVSVIRNILDDLALSPEQQMRAGEIVARQLRAVAGLPQVIEGGVA